MPWTQHVLTYPDYLAAGGTVPDGYTSGDDTVVIVCQDDDTGDIAWVSYAEADVPAEQRLNPDVPAVDWRKAP